MVRWIIRRVRAQIAARLPRETLLRQVVHGDNITALAAIEELKERLMFQDGSLQGISMAGARLQNVRLAKANISLVDFSGATLIGCYFGAADLRKARLLQADLSEGNLREAKLLEADLTGARLRGAHLAQGDFRRALLRSTDLTGANLWHTRLEAADLRGAILFGSNLQHALFDPETIMPDGLNWSDALDVERYTRAS